MSFTEENLGLGQGQMSLEKAVLQLKENKGAIVGKFPTTTKSLLQARQFPHNAIKELIDDTTKVKGTKARRI